MKMDETGEPDSCDACGLIWEHCSCEEPKPVRERYVCGCGVCTCGEPKWREPNADKPIGAQPEHGTVPHEPSLT